MRQWGAEAARLQEVREEMAFAFDGQEIAEDGDRTKALRGKVLIVLERRH